MATLLETEEGILFNPYVTGLIFNPLGHLLVGHRIDNRGWQPPQGGVERGETPLEAGLREIQEEFGIKPEELFLMAARSEPLVYPHYGRYDNPNSPRAHMACMAFLARKEVPYDLNSYHNDEEPEFDRLEWTEFERLPKIAPTYKQKLYEQAVADFSTIPEVLRSLGVEATSLEPQLLAQKASSRLFREAAFEFGANLEPTPPPFAGKKPTGGLNALLRSLGIDPI